MNRVKGRSEEEGRYINVGLMEGEQIHVVWGMIKHMNFMRRRCGGKGESKLMLPGFARLL